jgi:cyclase
MGLAVMLENRVIPILLVKNRGLVKTTKFSDPKYVGDPINAIRIFNEKEVDELVLLDISASPANRGPNFDLVKDVASECFMPLAYGGGISGVEDARRLFSLGVEKVVMRSAAVKDLRVVTEIAKFAGASSVAVSVDVKRSRFGRLQLFAPGCPLDGDSDWAGFIYRATEAGAGEILLNSVDQDGVMAGMNIEMIKTITPTMKVPLVAIGGVGSLDHIRAAIHAGANAVGAGAFFVYHGPRRAVLITYPTYDELSKLLGKK